MSKVADEDYRAWLQAKLNRADAIVACFQTLRSIWSKIRPKVTSKIGQVKGEDITNIHWPPLFVWLPRNQKEASALERALTAIRRVSGGEYKHARSQLSLPTNYGQSYSRIVEIVFIGRCLERAPAGMIELHPIVDVLSKKRSDLAMRLGDKRVYVEVSVLLERKADENFICGTRYAEQDGGRILAKLLDKVAEDCDPLKSQLSANEPNVIILAHPGVVGAYRGAFDWAFAAVDRCTENLRTVVLSRASRRNLALSQAEIDDVIAAFRNISAVRVFHDVEPGGLSYYREWRCESAKFPLADAELRDIINLFQEAQ